MNIGWKTTSGKPDKLNYEVTGMNIETGQILCRIENVYRQYEFLLLKESGEKRYMGTFTSIVHAQKFFENHIES